MSTEPDLMTKLFVVAGLLVMFSVHSYLLFVAARKAHISYYGWGSGYDRKAEPRGFWMCVLFNLLCLTFFVWILAVIALDSL